MFSFFSKDHHCDIPKEVKIIQQNMVDRRLDFVEAGNFNYTSLVAEALLFKDLLIIDSINDSYSNLLYKTTAALEWYIQYCSNGRYMALLDDDSFVFIDRLLKLINENQYGEQNLVLAGNRLEGYPIRDPFSKWAIPLSTYPLRKAPDFFNGVFFLMNTKVVQILLGTVKQINVERLGKQLDDFILTGFARALARIQEQHVCNFSIGAQPWGITQPYRIRNDTVVFISYPRNTYLIEKTYLFNTRRHINVLGLPYY